VTILGYKEFGVLINGVTPIFSGIIPGGKQRPSTSSSTTITSDNSDLKTDSTNDSDTTTMAMNMITPTTTEITKQEYIENSKE